MNKTMKKFLSFVLCALMLLSSVSVFAETTEDETTTPVSTYDFNDGSVTGWEAANGTASFNSDDYGYLEFAATAAEATLSSALDISAAPFTVDFRIMAEEAKAATISVGGYTVNLTVEDTKLYLNGTEIIPTLWYDVRVAVAGDGTAKLYLDGKTATAPTAETFANEFKVTLADSGTVIGIDDVVIYNGDKEDNELKSTALDFKFDGFEFTSNTTTNSTSTGTTGNIYTLPTIERENTKNDNSTFGTYGSNGGYNAVMGYTFRREVDVITKIGLFGKSKDDESIYWNHGTEAASSTLNTSGTDSTLEFSIGENGRLYNKGDKQVISFNMAFSEEVPESFEVRTWNWRDNNGSVITGGKWLNTSDAGWVMRILGDRMYLFGNTNYYTISPALMPNTWNNFRLEITNVGDGTNAATYSVYVNDIAVAKDINLLQTANKVRISGTNYDAEEQFLGIHRLVMNYDWSYSVNDDNGGGLYFDDIKVENFYNNAEDFEYETAPSPVTKNIGGTFETFEWDINKYVQGSVVYVDGEQTIGDYVSKLDNLGDSYDRIIDYKFRGADGTELLETQTFGNTDNVPVYADFTDNNFIHRYYKMDSTNHVLTSLDGDETSSGDNAVFKVWDATTYGEWQYDNYDAETTKEEIGAVTNVTSVSGLGGKKTETGDTDSFISVNNTSDSPAIASRRRIRYSLAPESPSYNYADPYKPITVEASVLMKNASDTMRISFWRSEGPAGSKEADGTSTKMNVGKLEGQVFISNAHSNGQAIALKANGGQFVGNYNVGEWNRISVSYYPGYDTYRLDVRLNGKLTNSMWKYQNSTQESSDKMLVQLVNAIQFDANSSTDTNSIYIDDVKITTGYYHAPELVSLASNDETKAIVEADAKQVIVKDSAMTVADVLESGNVFTSESSEVLGVYAARDYTTALADTATVSDGNIIVVQEGEIIEYYEIKEPAFEFYQGDALLADDANVTAGGGKLTVKTYANSGNVLILAQYDGEGNLLANGIATYTAEDDDEGTKITAEASVLSGAVTVKAMLWDGYTKIKPVILSAGVKTVATATE